MQAAFLNTRNFGKTRLRNTFPKCSTSAKCCPCVPRNIIGHICTDHCAAEQPIRLWSQDLHPGTFMERTTASKSWRHPALEAQKHAVVSSCDAHQHQAPRKCTPQTCREWISDAKPLSSRPFFGPTQGPFAWPGSNLLLHFITNLFLISTRRVKKENRNAWCARRLIYVNTVH